MRREQFFHRLSALGSKPSETDRADSFELAVSARRFSRRTQAVIDDKLSFSAALMRAGEVEAANRLLAEVGEEVLTEEVALLERVNEVKAARSVRPRGHDRVTRGRLVRTMAVAMLGASLLAFSAAGAAVVGMFREDQATHGSDPDSVGSAFSSRSDARGKGRRVKLTDKISLSMTPAQFREYSRLTDGEIDEDQLEMFLLELLPRNLAEQVHFVLVTGLETLPEPIAEEITVAANRLSERQASSDNDEKPGDQPTSEATDQPKEAQPTPEPSPTPSDDETPEPNESPEDKQNLPFFSDEGEGS